MAVVESSFSVEASVVLEDAIDVETVVVGDVGVKVTAVHIFCLGVIAVVTNALVFMTQTSLVVERGVVMEDVPPQTMHHTYTVKKEERNMSLLHFDHPI